MSLIETKGDWLSAYHNYVNVNVNPFARMPFIIRKGEVGHRRHAKRLGLEAMITAIKQMVAINHSIKA